MSSKKLLEQCQKLEKLWGHVLTGKYFYFGKQITTLCRIIPGNPSFRLICINFAGTLQLHSDNWYTKVTDLLEKQQTAPIWMSDTKVSNVSQSVWVGVYCSVLMLNKTSYTATMIHCYNDTLVQAPYTSQWTPTLL